MEYSYYKYNYFFEKCDIFFMDCFVADAPRNDMGTDAPRNDAE